MVANEELTRLATGNSTSVAVALGFLLVRTAYIGVVYVADRMATEVSFLLMELVAGAADPSVAVDAIVGALH